MNNEPDVIREARTIPHEGGWWARGARWLNIAFQQNGARQERRVASHQTRAQRFDTQFAELCDALREIQITGAFQEDARVMQESLRRHFADATVTEMTPEVTRRVIGFSKSTSTLIRYFNLLDAVCRLLRRKSDLAKRSHWAAVASLVSDAQAAAVKQLYCYGAFSIAVEQAIHFRGIADHATESVMREAADHLRRVRSDRVSVAEFPWKARRRIA